MPLIVRDPDPSSSAGRGRVVEAVTESVDVLPTICRWLGIEVPLQADGFPLQPFLIGEPAPDRWRKEAHWSWAFSDPADQMAERLLGIPMAHCTLDVVRGADTKYVQFAADGGLFPPILFDLARDPEQLHDLVRAGEAGELGWRSAERLLQWRMRTDDRTLSGNMLTPDRGLVVARDEWW